MKRTKFGAWVFCWILGLVFVFVSGFFAFTTEGLNILKAGDVHYVVTPLSILDSLIQGIKTFYTSLIDLTKLNYFIITVVVLAVILVVLVAQIVVYGKAKNKKTLWWLIFTVIVGAITVWITGYTIYVILGHGSFTNAAKALLPWLTFRNTGVGVYISIFIYLLLIGLLLTYVSSFVILIKTFVYVNRYNKYYDLVVNGENPVDALTYEGNNNPGVIGAPNTNNINTVGNSSPLIVQYINSYGTDSAFARVNNANDKPCGGPAPVAPENTNKECCNQKPMNPCCGGYYPPYPWWYYPPQPPQGEKPLTKEDVRELLSELKKDDSPEEVEVKYQNADGEELEYIDLDELKGLLKHEVESFLETELNKPQKEEKPVEKVEKEPELTIDETVGYKEIQSQPVVEKAPEVVAPVNVPETRVELTTPLVVAMPAKVETEKPVEEELSEEEIRDLVSSEILNALKDLPKPKSKVIHKVVTKEVPVEVVKEVPVEVVKEVPVEVIKEVKVEQPVVEEKPVVVEEKPAKVQPIVKKQPVKRGQETEVVKGEIIRLNFLERIAEGDQLLKDNYNAIKGLLMSYGLKNRLSNTGDTFRLHKKTYAKITCSGESLKLYLALNPKDFQSTALPVQDVSNKDAYKDIPLAFKVRSELSLRRANELIATCMRQDNLEVNPDFEKLDYTKEIITELENEKKVEAAIAKNKNK